MMLIIFKGGVDNDNSVKGQKQRHLAGNLHTVGKQHLGRRCRWVNNTKRSKKNKKLGILSSKLTFYTYDSFIIQDCIGNTLLWRPRIQNLAHSVSLTNIVYIRVEF